MQYLFERRFAMAHRLTSTKSPKCMTPHGHNELVSISIVPGTGFDRNARVTDGMLVEFGEIKTRWHDWIDNYIDHGFQLNEEDPFYKGLGEYRLHWRLVIFPCDPTTEVLASAFMRKCSAFLNASSLAGKFMCSSITVAETPTNGVTVNGHDTHLFLPGSGWWDIPNMSTR